MKQLDIKNPREAVAGFVMILALAAAWGGDPLWLPLALVTALLVLGSQNG